MSATARRALARDGYALETCAASLGRGVRTFRHRTLQALVDDGVAHWAYVRISENGAVPTLWGIVPQKRKPCHECDGTGQLRVWSALDPVGFLITCGLCEGSGETADWG